MGNTTAARSTISSLLVLAVGLISFGVASSNVERPLLAAVDVGLGVAAAAAASIVAAFLIAATRSLFSRA